MMFRKLFATILVTAVGAGVGFAGAKFQPTQWQASAQFEQPRIAELGNYFSLFSTYHLISGDATAADMSKMEVFIPTSQICRRCQIRCKLGK